MRIFIDFYYDPSNRLDMRNKVIYRVTSKRQAVCDRGTVLLSRHCISSFMTRSDTNYRNGVVDVLFDDFW